MKFAELIVNEFGENSQLLIACKIIDKNVGESVCHDISRI